MSAEQRVHTRVQVLTEIEISWGGRRVKAELRDISKGGARVLCPTFSGAVGSVVELFVASLTGSEIAIAAEVVRLIPGDDGTAVALRFSAVAREMRPALLELIDVLVTTSQAEPSPRDERPSRRMEVRCAEPGDLRAVLRDIAAGGLAMSCEEALVLYEPIEVSVPDFKGNPLLVLRAQVVEQQPVADEEGAPYYDVFVEFGDMRPEARGCLESLMQDLADGG